MIATTTKNVLLTGATRGIGRAMVDGLVAAGQTILGCGRSKDKIRELAERHGAPHHFAVVDVADDSQVARWAEEVLARSGPPDLILNNAATIHAPAPL